MASARATTSFFRTLHHLRQPQTTTTISLIDSLLPRQSQQQLRRFHHHSPTIRNTLSRNTPKRNFTSSRKATDSSKPPTGQYNPTPHLNAPKESLSITQKLKKLSREYGWAAFGVYMALTALDLPLCFLAVRSIGTEKVGEWEHKIVEYVKKAVPLQIPEKYQIWKKDGAVVTDGGLAGEGAEKVESALAGYDHGVREAEELNKGDNASIWTQLALAYAIHKSFIFIRVPITAAITPKVVKTLRGWGWNIGKRRPKAERIAAKEARKASTVQAK